MNWLKNWLLKDEIETFKKSVLECQAQVAQAREERDTYKKRVARTALGIR